MYAQRAEQVAGHRQAGVGAEAGEAEVGDLDPAVASSSRLPGLMSRWTMPSAWACSSASAASAISSAAGGRTRGRGGRCAPSRARRQARCREPGEPGASATGVKVGGQILRSLTLPARPR